MMLQTPLPARGSAFVQPAVHVLHPGDVACGERGDRLETLLGSCVAIILTDPRRTIGAMCHVVHTGLLSHPSRLNTCHGDNAMGAMFARLHQRGISPALCDAYLYGGGNLFPAQYGAHNVGTANVRWAHAVLDAMGIPVLGSDTGGNAYRRLSWTVGNQPPAVACVSV